MLAAPGCHHAGAEGTMRIQGPAGTATNATPSTGRRATSARFHRDRPGGGLAGRRSRGDAARRRHRCADRIAGGGRRNPAPARRGAVKRGRLALDALEELKIGLLGGTLAPATLNRLRSAATALKDGSGEAELDGALGEIELRVEVEIAKMAAR